MSNTGKALKRNTAQATPAGVDASGLPEAVMVTIPGGVWACAPVSERPQVVLTDWRVFDVPFTGEARCTRHFVGYNASDCEGRVSSPIVKFDPATLCGVTKSGRIYALRGSPGWHGDAEYTWNRWLGINGVTDVVDVTADIAALPARMQ